jgi:hypothetical protein
MMGQGQLVNLSVPGCLLKTTMKLKVGQYADLRLSFATSPVPLQIKLAAVRWVKGGQVGLEFIRMSEADQTRLRFLAGYIEKRTPQQAWSERVICVGTTA